MTPRKDQRRSFDSPVSVPEPSSRPTATENTFEESDASTSLQMIPSTTANGELVLRTPDEVVQLVTQAVQQKNSRTRLTATERWRRSQQRKQAYVDHITQEVEELRREINQLLAIRNGLYQERGFTRPFTSSGTVMQIVYDYYTMFRYGYMSARGDNGVMHSLAMKEAYVRSITQPSMVGFGGQVASVDGLLEQWRRYTQSHASLQVEIISMHLITVDIYTIVSVKSMLQLRYSWTSIAHIFPHLLENPPLVQRLVGRMVYVPMTNDIYFDQEGKFCRYEVALDYVTAFLEVLGNCEDVSIVLGRANMEHGALVYVSNDGSKRPEVWEEGTYTEEDLSHSSISRPPRSDSEHYVHQQSSLFNDTTIHRDSDLV